MLARHEALGLVERCFRAIESSDRAALEALLDGAVTQEELPNRLRPDGGNADRAAMLAAFE